MNRAHSKRLTMAVALLTAGFLLRAYFVRRHPFLAGDSILYQDIALNWLHARVYGLSTDAAPRATLIRLPGYPAVLALLALIFDPHGRLEAGTLRSFMPVLWMQVVADMLTCGVVAMLARRIAGNRAALATLAIACLCPFTANYTAVPLTETLTLLSLAVTFYALERWLREQGRKWLAVLAASVACGILLRPDQGLVAAAVLPAVLLTPRRLALAKRGQAAMLFVLLTALPFAPWTVRNLRTFHVFQPLAPKLANDPGEAAPVGFQRWFRTWGVDFSATEDAYWKYPEETVLITDLPERAFDSPEQRARTATLLDEAAQTHKLQPEAERGFEALARERIHAHPLRYYVVLPVARLVNMALHPRTEMLPVAERWWQFRLHRAQTEFALGYAALNLAYLVAGFLGIAPAMRMGRSLVLSMVSYALLRCLLLLTIDNAEQRYTLELYPLLFVFAGVWLGRLPLLTRKRLVG